MSLVERSMTVFFRHHHDLEFCSFIHKPTFALDTADPFLISAIVSLSSLYLSQTLDPKEYGFDSSHHMTNTLINVSRRLSRETADIPSSRYPLTSIRQLTCAQDLSTHNPSKPCVGPV